MNVVLMSLWCHIKLLVYQTREVDDIITCTRLSLLDEQAEFGGHFVTLRNFVGSSHLSVKIDEFCVQRDARQSHLLASLFH